MQHDTENFLPEGEVIELPEPPAGGCERSAWSRAMLWVTLLSFGGSAMYVMYFRTVSQASGAMPAQNLLPAPDGGAARLTDFLGTSQDQLPALRAALGQTGGMLHALLDDSLARQIPLAALRCNPFREPEPSAPAGRVTPTTAPAAPQQQEAQRAAMLQAVEAMQLQSISAAGSHPSCMINDVLYIEGGIINGFVIEQINPQSVVIRNGLYNFELTPSR
ncbi:MAG TPA: hypothetical protein VHY37_10930 [Tepidisphaeraceae bacterium]|jgi:hypothetical protein|nr:hypothetical protein [Tepidisphaeraceae bacterium]